MYFASFSFAADYAFKIFTFYFYSESTGALLMTNDGSKPDVSSVYNIGYYARSVAQQAHLPTPASIEFLISINSAS